MSENSYTPHVFKTHVRLSDDICGAVRRCVDRACALAVVGVEHGRLLAKESLGPAGVKGLARISW
jgi:hypothetical protein